MHADMQTCRHTYTIFQAVSTVWPGSEVIGDIPQLALYLRANKDGHLRDVSCCVAVIRAKLWVGT